MSRFKFKAILGLLLSFTMLIAATIAPTLETSRTSTPELIPISTPAPLSPLTLNQSGLDHNLPVLAIDLHETALERDNMIAVKEIFKAPKHGFKFIKRAIKYKKAKKKGKTRASIEEYVTRGSTDPEFNQMTARTVSCFKPMPGTIELLSKLKQRGYKLFVFSNIGPQSYELIKHAYPELFNLFDGAVIVRANQLTKDHPAAYKYCVTKITETLGYRPTKVILFDDLAQNCNLAKQTDPIFDVVICDSSSRAKLTKSQENLLQLLEKYNPYNPELKLV